MQKTIIAISGITGKMGHILVDLIATDFADQFDLKYGISRLNINTTIQYDFPLLPDISDQTIDVVIDFSIADYAFKIIQQCSERNIPIVSGTTGFTNEQYKVIQQCALKNLILHSHNMSYAVNLMAAITQIAASSLPETFDVELLDIHHKNKVDAPSGTALFLAEGIANARNTTLQNVYLENRSTLRRTKHQQEIGIASIRSGEDMIGEHKVMFANQEERIEIMHRSSSRKTYARGALTAAQWLLKQKTGRLYSMTDIFDKFLNV